MAITQPGDTRTAQTSHSANLHSYMDGVRQAGHIIRRDTGGITFFMRHPAVTWTRVGTLMTCTWGGGAVPGHPFVDGDQILVRDCSSTLALASNAYYTVDSTGTNTFTIPCNNAGATSGWFCGYQVVDGSAIANVRSGLDLFINTEYPNYADEGNGAPFPGNTVYGVDNEDFHNVCGGGIDSQDRYWFVGNMHASELNAIYSAPNSIKSWSAPYVGGGGSYPFLTGLTGANAHTYSHMVRLPNDKLLWMIDQQESPSFSRGRDYLQAVLPVGVGTTWQPVQSTWEFVVSTNIANTVGGSQDVPANRVYITGVTVWEDKIHYSITFRIWDGEEEGAKHAAYVWSYLSDLTVVYNIHGDVMAMPLTHGATAAARAALGMYVYESDLTHFVSGTGQGIAIDSLGYPHITLTIQQHDGSGNALAGTSSGFRDHYWDGSAWVIGPALTGGANGPTQVPYRDDLITLSEGNRVSGDSSTRSCRLKSKNAGTLWYYGRTTPTYSPMVDPVKLYETGILSFQVTDGDDPWVYEFGGHAQRDAGLWLHEPAAEAADGSITLDLTTAGLGWLALRLIVTAQTSTSVAWTVDDSSDETTWVAKTPTFQATTGPGEELIRIAGWRRYVRLSWVRTGGGSVTFGAVAVKNTSND